MAEVNQAPGVVTRVLADPVRMYLPSPYWNRARDWFAFNLDFNTLAAGAVGTQQAFTVQNDSDFLCCAVVGHVATAAAGTTEQPEWPFLISVQDTGSGANWFGDQAGGGTGGFAHMMNFVEGLHRSASGGVSKQGLEHPRFVPAASTVTVALTNLDGANARRIWLSFRGVKIYRSLRQGQ